VEPECLGSQTPLQRAGELGSSNKGERNRGRPMLGACWFRRTAFSALPPSRRMPVQRFELVVDASAVRPKLRLTYVLRIYFSSTVLGQRLIRT
jgi:hypothetical protein